MRDLTQTPFGSLDTDTVERGNALGFSAREAYARIQSYRDRQAENAAQLRRLDKDRIIQAALDTLESDSIDKARDSHLSYLAGCANIPMERFIGDTRFADGIARRATYIRDLLAEIRRDLSPLVTGRDVYSE